MSCDEARKRAAEVLSFQDDVNRIIDDLTIGEGKGRAYHYLAILTDSQGPRLSGSQNLERAIDDVKDSLRGLEAEGAPINHAEELVKVPHWERGEESLTVIEPFYAKFPVLGLGTTIGTPEGGIDADTVVLKTFADLNFKNVTGRIVVFNMKWTSYKDLIDYRVYGAENAAKYGALAVLIRSLTDFSIGTVHTGDQVYNNSVPKIPTATISTEVADMFERIYKRGYPLRLFLVMNDRNLADTYSRNVIATITGYEKPNEMVVFGAHIDSWDVGTGAMDDGAGVMICMQALRTINRLNLRPRRTLKMILWTGEEFGFYGSIHNFKEHKADADNMSLIMESDFGTMVPYGIGFSGNGSARYIMEQTNLLKSLGLNRVTDDGKAPDTAPWLKKGVPGANLYGKSDDYFHYHHTQGDMINILDPHQLDLCAVVWTTVIHVIGNLENMLPREGDYPTQCFKSTPNPSSLFSSTSHRVLPELVLISSINLLFYIQF